MIGCLSGFVGVLVWLYLLTGRGSFWRITEAPSRHGRLGPAHVIVIVPARDEAESIGGSLTSILRQDYSKLSVVLVDDHSSDATVSLARNAARTLGAEHRLDIVPARPLPPGWSGKVWAMSEGVRHISGQAPDFILFTDADIVHAPDSIAELVEHAILGDFDLVSYMVRLSTEALPEKLLVPAFVFFFFKLYPPRWVVDPKSKVAAAAGGCMLVRAAALERIGGLSTIRDRLIDDCSLAAAIKGSGGRVRMDPTRTTSCNRLHRSFGDLWSMIARTAFTQLRHSPLVLASTVAGMCIAYIEPPILAIGADGPARWFGLASWVLMALCFCPTVRFYGLNPAWCLALPGAALFYSAATIYSAVAFWQGKGGQWKGRTQAARPRAGVRQTGAAARSGPEPVDNLGCTPARLGSRLEGRSPESPA